MIKKQWSIAAVLLCACADNNNTEKTEPASVVNAPIVASGAFSALLVSDHNKQEVSIYLGEDEENFCSVTLPRKNINAGFKAESKRRKNENISIDCMLKNDGYFVRSVNHSTYAGFEIVSLDRKARTAEVHFHGQFINVKTNKFLTVEAKAVSITGIQFDNLVKTF